MPQEATEEVVWSGSPYLMLHICIYLWSISIHCFNSFLSMVYLTFHQGSHSYTVYALLLWSSICFKGIQCVFFNGQLLTYGLSVSCLWYLFLCLMYGFNESNVLQWSTRCMFHIYGINSSVQWSICFFYASMGDHQFICSMV